MNCRASRDPEPALTYMGSNDYHPEVHYKYVGHGTGAGGAGELHMLPHQPNHGCRLFMCAFLAVLAVSLSGSVIYLGRFLFTSDRGSVWSQLAGTAGGAPAESEAANGSSSFNCRDSSRPWSDAQRTFCCTSAGIGCQTDKAGHDCTKDLANWAEVWTPQKKDWCCRNKQAGCFRSTQFDCTAGTPASWPTQQKVWCCINRNQGCPSEPLQSTAAGSQQPGLVPVGAVIRPSESSPSCNAICVVENKPDATCRQRLAYAAQHIFGGRPDACVLAHAKVARHCVTCGPCAPEGRFCGGQGAAGPVAAAAATTAAPEARTSGSSGSTTRPFDCIAGYANWENVWSTRKKAWCCVHGGLKLGCPTTARPSASPAASTSGAPAPVTTFLIPFDCLAGLASWKSDWSSRKKSWCCQHSQRGCEGPQPAPSKPPALVDNGPPFDCTAGYSDWEATWSIIKKAWCCQHHQQGCPPRMSSVPYNCNDGFSHWKADWSGGKKKWCCRNTGKGCEKPGDSDFDCVAGYSKWESIWSRAKKKFCCARVDCRSTV
eukprot:CAMPEP_0204552362 /NCGR_PEP_ID=MMETSP0661-20131031/26544_1 /ASSEMBLY_ACC=CAM_ASM_000606 /TAXON_ID=109239 /ORGANISM="Alexandrium margalefi, Strain AMGDE01CS-322" /LENGTH=542 /DNA_ID=CAMNT_0051559371 /DNA_START=59 /DNA_END=1687 /DNA_ORIENTATION=-